MALRAKDGKSKNNDNRSRWFSEYGNSENRHIVFYDGIGPDQVLASALGKYALDHPQIEDKATGTVRQLCDGGYLSNTPLRELLTAHKNYWMEYLRKNRRGSQKSFTRAPELEVYIVNLHPLAPKDIPQDKDLIDDRESDILFHDAGDLTNRITVSDILACCRACPLSNNSGHPRGGLIE